MLNYLIGIFNYPIEGLRDFFLVDKKKIVDRLYRKGLYCIPVKTKDKKPVLNNWNKNLWSKQEMINYLNDNPTINVGVVTGSKSGLLVLDFDREEGEADYQRLIIDQKIETYTIKTPNGYHCYFKTDKEYTGSIKELSFGTDIRAYNNQVVTIGSINAEGVEYLELNDSPVNELPKKLSNLLKRFIKPNEYPELLIDGLEVEKPSNSSYMATRPKAINRSITTTKFIKNLDVIQKGERDERLFKVACYFRNKGYVQADILEALRDINNDKVNPPVNDSILKEKVKSCLKYEDVSRVQKINVPIVIPTKRMNFFNSLDPKVKTKAIHLYYEMYIVHTSWGEEYKEIAHYTDFYSKKLGLTRQTLQPILKIFKKEGLFSIKKKRLKTGKNFDTHYLIFNPEV